MRRVRFAWQAAAVVAGGAALAACAIVEGLNDLAVDVCGYYDAASCDGSTRDGTLDALPVEAGDAPSEAAQDASDAGSAEAAPDCGPLDTIANCGACGQACDTQRSDGPQCSASDAGGCSYGGCKHGWGDCDQAPPNTNGCETPIGTTLNCTRCNAKCDTLRASGASCNLEAGTCEYTGCAQGFLDCDKGVPPNTNGCESLENSPNSCGGCGNKCDQQTGQPTCITTPSYFCRYACNANRIDCDMDAAMPDGAPNLDLNGCECPGYVCCANPDGGPGTCPIPHSNGLSPPQTYYDCNPLGTFNATTATEACNAFADGGCTTGQCALLDGGALTGEFVACPTTPDASDCPCWSYADDAGSAGHVLDPHMGGSCLCPSASDPTWN